VKLNAAVSVEDWNALARASRSETLFYRRVVVLAAIRAWPRQPPVSLITGHCDGRLVFLQPCLIMDNPIGRTIELLDVPTAGRVEALIVPEDRNNIVDAFRAYLLDVMCPDVFIARSLTGDFQDRLGLIRRDAILRQHTGPQGWYLHLPDSLEGL
jgi:hypothetical protein